VFENRVLRRVFGPKRDEVTGDGRKLRDDELHNLYSSPNIITMIKSMRIILSEHVARIGRRMHVGYWWKSQKERPRRGWVDSIKTDLGEIGLDGVDWICLARDRDQGRALVKTVMNLFHKILGSS
jgi:hypothetical protein